MTDMMDRQKAFEAKYAHNEEVRFKIEARRNKMLGVWAAGLMHKNASDTEAYAKEVIIADFQEVGDDDVLRKVYVDLQQADVNITKDDIRQKMNEYLDQACEDMQKVDA